MLAILEMLPFDRRADRALPRDGPLILPVDSPITRRRSYPFVIADTLEVAVLASLCSSALCRVPSYAAFILVVAAGGGGCADSPEQDTSGTGGDTSMAPDTTPATDIGPDTGDTGPTCDGQTDNTGYGSGGYGCGRYGGGGADSGKDAARGDSTSPDADTSNTGESPYQWAVDLGKADDREVPAVALDSEGGAVLAGEIGEPLGDRTYQGGESDAFVARYDSSGERRWVRLLGTEREEGFEDVAVDADGGIYATGEPGAPVAGQETGGWSDGLIAHYGPDGERRWVRTIATDKRERIEDVVAGDSGGAYVAGWTRANPDADSQLDGQDAFIARYDDTGDRSWIHQVGTDAIDTGKALSLGDDGDVYLAGTTTGDIGQHEHTGEEFADDAFLARYTPDGTRQWVRVLAAEQTAEVADLTLDDSGKLYLAGSTAESLADQQYQGGFRDAFVAAYTTSGDRSWVRLLGGPARDYAYTVAADDGRVLVGGKTEGGLDGADFPTDRSTGFVVAIAPDGTRRHTRPIAAESSSTVSDLAPRPSGPPYVTGWTSVGLVDSDRYLVGGYLALPKTR